MFNNITFISLSLDSGQHSTHIPNLSGLGLVARVQETLLPPSPFLHTCKQNDEMASKLLKSCHSPTKEVNV